MSRHSKPQGKMSKQARAEACRADVDKALDPILKRWRCVLQPVPVIVEGKIFARLSVIALDDPESESAS